MIDDRVEAVLAFWFGALEDPEVFPDTYKKRWWTKDPALDADLRERFLGDLERLAEGDLEHWRDDPRSCLAYIVLADQFSRNIFRGTSRAFALDARVQEAATVALEAGLDRSLHTAERLFFRMPLMHSEDRAIQERSVSSFEKLEDDVPEVLRAEVAENSRYARAHRDIVVRFRRFPHRNELLGRPSTAEEIAFLEQPGSSF